MDKYISLVWKEIIKYCEICMREDQSLVLYTDAEELFYKNFKYFHSYIVKNFMKMEDENLDRHKIASVIICAILESNIVGICKSERDKLDNNIFLANEKIALNVGLCEMHRLLEKEFEAGNIPYERIFEQIALPDPLSCNRDYTEVICRDLYFSKKHYVLNPISLANFLFLLEAYAFSVYQIPIKKEQKMLIEESRKKENARKELEAINKELLLFEERKKQEYDALDNRKKQLEDIVSD